MNRNIPRNNVKTNRRLTNGRRKRSKINVKTREVITTNRSINNRRRPQRRTRQKKMIYREKVPVANSISVTNRNPIISQRGNRVIIRHREYYSDIANNTENTGFQPIITELLNPGLSRQFPWLSKIANNYESYRFTKFELHYLPSCPTSTPGSLMFVLDFDVNEQPFISATEMLNSNKCVSIPPYTEKIIPYSTSEVNKMMSSRMVTDRVYPKAEAVQYYFCRMNAALTGVNSNVTLGRMFIDYEIELRTPIAKDIDAKYTAYGNTLCQKDHPLLGNGATGTGTTYQGNPYYVSLSTGGSFYDALTFFPGAYRMHLQTWIETEEVDPANPIILEEVNMSAIQDLGFHSTNTGFSGDYLIISKLGADTLGVKFTDTIPSTTVITMFAEFWKISESEALGYVKWEDERMFPHFWSDLNSFSYMSIDEQIHNRERHRLKTALIEVNKNKNHKLDETTQDIDSDQIFLECKTLIQGSSLSTTVKAYLTERLLECLADGILDVECAYELLSKHSVPYTIK